MVGRAMLESLHRSEVIVKKWGPPIGNQYYRSFMPDVSITLCSNCNKVGSFTGFSHMRSNGGRMAG